MFLFDVKRRVMNDRTVSLHGRVYEVDPLLVGQTVTSPCATTPPRRLAARCRCSTTAPTPGWPPSSTLTPTPRQALPPLPPPPTRRSRAPAAAFAAGPAPPPQPGERLMYLRHFAFTRWPFAANLEADQLFASSSRQEAEARLHLLDLCGIGLLTGEVGCGKTSVCRAVTATLHPGLLGHRQRHGHVTSQSPGNSACRPNAPAPPPTAPSAPRSPVRSRKPGCCRCSSSTSAASVFILFGPPAGASTSPRWTTMTYRSADPVRTLSL